MAGLLSCSTSTAREWRSPRNRGDSQCSKTNAILQHRILCSEQLHLMQQFPVWRTSGRRNSEESRRIQRNPEKCKGIQRNPEESQPCSRAMRNWSCRGWRKEQEPALHIVRGSNVPWDNYLSSFQVNSKHCSLLGKSDNLKSTVRKALVTTGWHLDFFCCLNNIKSEPEPHHFTEQWPIVSRRLQLWEEKKYK